MKTNICVAVYFHFSSVKIYSGGTGLHVKGMFNLIQNFQTPFQGVLFYTHPDNQVDFSCQSTSFHGYIITFSIGSSWRDGAMYGSVTLPFTPERRFGYHCWMRTCQQLQPTPNFSCSISLVFYWCITMTTKLAAYDNTHLLFHHFYCAWAWTWVSWVLCVKFQLLHDLTSISSSDLKIAQDYPVEIQRKPHRQQH